MTNTYRAFDLALLRFLERHKDGYEKVIEHRMSPRGEPLDDRYRETGRVFSGDSVAAAIRPDQ